MTAYFGSDRQQGTFYGTYGIACTRYSTGSCSLGLNKGSWGLLCFSYHLLVMQYVPGTGSLIEFFDYTGHGHVPYSTGR
jgi:hypothetical protein